MTNPIANDFDHKVVESWTRLEGWLRATLTADERLSWGEVFNLVNYPGEYSLSQEKIALLGREPYKGWFLELARQADAEYGGALAAADSGADIFLLQREWERSIGEASRLHLTLDKSGEFIRVQVDFKPPVTERPYQKLYVIARDEMVYELAMADLGEGLFVGKCQVNSPLARALLDKSSVLVML